jgi:hypothetical protein
MFADGNRFGDPDARRNAEQWLQVLCLPKSSRTIANRLNWFTLLGLDPTVVSPAAKSDTRVMPARNYRQRPSKRLPATRV